MGKYFKKALDKGLGKLFGSIVLFPVLLLNVWVISKLGFFAWAEFPDPTWRQIVVMAAIAAYVST